MSLLSCLRAAMTYQVKPSGNVPILLLIGNRGRISFFDAESKKALAAYGRNGRISVSDTGGMEEAIMATIMKRYADDRTKGLFRAASYVLPANEGRNGDSAAGQDKVEGEIMVYLLVFREKYSTYGGAGRKLFSYSHYLSEG
ncbi:MAG: hypothetical protein NC081_03730 [Roseburia sp.]|nr:hypothetical protein [Roseburia sp.]